MAHYAFVGSDNIVVEVIVGRDENEGVDWEAYYAAVRGLRCLRTSYRTLNGWHPEGRPFRQNYAAVGGRFDATIGPDGAFLPPE